MTEVKDEKLDVQHEEKETAETQNTSTNMREEEENEGKEAGASEPKHVDKKKALSATRKTTADTDESKVDTIDELTSLEQELAKMHNIQHGTEAESSELTASQTKSENGNRKPENGNGNKLVDKVTSDPKQATSVKSKNEVKLQTETEATLEEVDLIALLKGTDQESDTEPKKSAALPKVNPKSNIEMTLAELDNVGVTIEGEGQYEIMEIDDGENNSSVASPLPAKVSSKNSSKIGVKYPLATSKPKLSPEQARAVALEQMADLKAHAARRKESAVRQQQPQQSLDISALNDDWDEYESDNDNDNGSSSKAPSVVAMSKAITKRSVKVMIKSTTQKPTEKPKPVTEQLTNTNVESTGFKRTRVIKPKIIWDPDVPETQKSFAQYATTKAASTLPSTARAVASPNRIHLEIGTKKAPRPATPKELTKVAAKRAATPAPVSKLESTATPAKRRPQTPSVQNGTAASSAGKKKKISEIDRLMGDEGAANMMQAVEREQRELSGGEVSNKPLMRKRSLTISCRQQQQQQQQQPQKSPVAAVADAEPAPVAVKKESSPKTIKRGANNATATVAAKPRASASWDYVYKQRASEESMIMRRRSNSSYSSNASVNRLSLDTKPAAESNLSDDATDMPPANDPTFKFLKPETKANQRNDSSATPQTLANDLKRTPPTTHSKPTAAGAELVAIQKLDKLTHLIISPQQSKMGYTYKMQLLQKLTELLNKLAKSNDCNTVLLSVQEQQFCQGIDCQEVIAVNLEKRKVAVNQLATVLKTYLRTLATFPKPLVAGIVGNLKNLGVMQLPLLDYVVAADSCTFECNYAKLGQLPEGYALWHNHQRVSSQVHSRLFLLGERLQASNIQETSNSFINKSCPARVVNEQALAMAQLISSNTADNYRALKKLNNTGNTTLMQRFDAEFKILTEQWSSATFQTNYKRYINELLHN